jgi:hypothetical protein
VQVLSVSVAGLALVVSVIVFVDNRLRAIETARLARRPALAFTWDGVTKRWSLDNIGNGPALDVVIVQSVAGTWSHPIRMPELAADQSMPVSRIWVEEWDENPGLGARYRSITGEQYMTQTGDDWSQMKEGWDDFPPSLWEAVQPHWRYSDR